MIAWDSIVAQLPAGERSPSMVKERWTRVLKARLLEKEMDPEETWRYRRDLLEHIIRLGVTDRREIRWREVAQHFQPKPSSALVILKIIIYVIRIDIFTESGLLEYDQKDSGPR